MRIRTAMLLLVTVATLSVTYAIPATGQSVCYRPDGSMYIGRERPADCSPTRPKSRDEDVQRRTTEEAVGRVERDAARRATEAEREGVLNRSHDAHRILINDSAKAIELRAQQAIKDCEAYRAKPETMPRSGSSLLPLLGEQDRSDAGPMRQRSKYERRSAGAREA